MTSETARDMGATAEQIEELEFARRAHKEAEIAASEAHGAYADAERARSAARLRLMRAERICKEGRQ